MLIGNTFEDLFYGMFYIITELGRAIFTAPINIIVSAFPDLSTPLRYVVAYFSVSLTYVPLILDLLMIPRGAFVYLFDYYVIKAGIYLVTRTVRLFLNVYNKLKI